MSAEEKATADVLAEAGDYLESHGWWRGGLRGPNRRQVCALGAILFSQGLNEGQAKTKPVLQAVNAFLNALPEEFQTGAITSWNDHDAKNKQEVLDIFRKAEKIERAGFDPDAP
jgi:hypothetical protein